MGLGLHVGRQGCRQAGLSAGRADADAVEAARAWWRERLTELGTILTQGQ
jgi:hypothetical protein